MLILTFVLVLSVSCVVAQGQIVEIGSAEKLTWELGPTGSVASLRGLSAPEDQTIWACGSGSCVIRSIDGGSSWTECGPQGYAELEFRSIHAWSGDAACIASAGAPAVILITSDAGKTWREVYRHPSEKAFFDGLKFWDGQHGIVFGDPLDGKPCLLESFDGGKTWQAIDPLSLPDALEGEAGFAASNSAMHIQEGGKVWVGLGGRLAKTSRMLMRASWTSPWSVVECPLHAGPAQGIFSIASSQDSRFLVAVGGDYRVDETSATTAAFSTNQGMSWQTPRTSPAFFCSAVVSLPVGPLGESVFIATGPRGSHFSPDGQQWQEFSRSGFHVLAVGPQMVFAAGADGRFARLKLGR